MKRGALAFAFALGLAGCAERPVEPRVLRLVEHLADARVATQRREWIDPESFELKPGSVTAPAGFTSASCPQVAAARACVARFVAAPPRPFRLQLDLPVVGGRDWVVRARVREPNAQVLIEHAPAPEQPEPGWHKATVQRAGDRRQFDWREDVPPGRDHMAVVIESEKTGDVTIEALTFREAGARDPSLVDGAPAVSFRGLVDRPVDGVKTESPRGARRLVPSLLASEDGVYEWALPGWAHRFDVETAVVPRGAGARAIEMRVEVATARGWETLARAVRGEPEDGGGWRPLGGALPREARALRLITRAQDPARPPLVAWGNPVLRAERGARKPHVVLITLDAVRPDHLNAYGYTRPTSRFLALLAAEGARFDDVSAQRGHTWASTTSLVTGLYPESTGVIARGARSERGTRGFVSELAAAGYQTGRIGSPDLPRGQIPGFDFAEIADLDVDIFSRVDALARAAQSDGRPLFLWVHLANAHYPWRVADEFNRFDPDYRGRYASGLTRAEFRALEDDPGALARERQHFEALYDGAIQQMDVRLARTMAGLARTGFFDDAIVSVTADHGTHLGEHGTWFLHSSPWRASLDVPLILFAPGRIRAGVVVGREQGRALLVDLGPTLLELAGVRSSAALDGMSLVPALGGARLPSRTTVTHFQPAGYAVVANDRYELFYNPGGEPLTWPGELHRQDPLPRLGLYDRALDPKEEHDLALSEPLIAGALRAAALASASATAQPLSSEARQLLKQAGYADED